MMKGFKQLLCEQQVQRCLSMYGPYDLNDQEIDNHIEAGRMGNYVYLDAHHAVRYVGRSDTDLRYRIHHGIEEGYRYFMFSYAKSTREAYETECRLYHKFEDEGLDNDIHPDKPNGKNYACPVCGE